MLIASITAIVLVAAVFGCACIYLDNKLTEQRAESARLRAERDACERAAVALANESVVRARQAGHAPTIEAESWAGRVPGKLS